MSILFVIEVLCIVVLVADVKIVVLSSLLP